MATLSDVVKQISEALGLSHEEVIAEVTKWQAKYPDSEVAFQAFLDWYMPKVTGKLSVESLISFAKDIWSELSSGRPGYNPHHGVIG